METTPSRLVFVFGIGYGDGDGDDIAQARSVLEGLISADERNATST